ncbi:MAG: Txe/YoeB family addiction module toxin [Ellagibacter isourolithinifaciens]|uniref:Txe/YoeB family addiction module toxin n=1 Tax=Ellagibacter isourolithinifaciens TaxID=2137581 RepID=UPI002A898837|nr:Txe/YoeB family addiction module toxin [Ellagibacter isourolithinifaciens]MDY4989465.1 Txe/YoeB family addiction module toxin [Ellagibacter isourolithinifaciens]
MIKAWDDEAWGDYLHWQTQDRKTLRQINALLKDIDRNGYDGIGKPEPLRENLSGWWSRRIDDSNRIVYRIREGRIEIIQCGSHYRDS